MSSEGGTKQMSSEGALDAPLWFLYNPHRPLGLSMEADGCGVTSMDPRSQLCSQLGAHPVSQRHLQQQLGPAAS